MTSLKEGVIPKLAKWLKLSPAAIYERQRALMRAGLLESEPGRGPGSGVRATPKSVAMLLTALVASVFPSESAELTGKVAKLKSDTKRCQFTGKKTFIDALSHALSSEEQAARILQIQAEHGEGDKLGASIYFRRTAEEMTAAKEANPLGIHHRPYHESHFGEAGVRKFIESAAVRAFIGHDYEYESNRVEVGLNVLAKLHLPFAELAKEIRGNN
jgi:hypothetical protein